VRCRVLYGYKVVLRRSATFNAELQANLMKIGLQKTSFGEQNHFQLSSTQKKQNKYNLMNKKKQYN
jgi:hypothetical protein